MTVPMKPDFLYGVVYKPVPAECKKCQSTNVQFEADKAQQVCLDCGEAEN